MLNNKGSSSLPLFLADEMLKGMVRWLRFLGYDTQTTDQVERENHSDRIFLTRRHKEKASLETGRMVQIEALGTGAQIAEVISKLNLDPVRYRFRLCSDCNVRVHKAVLEQVRNKVPHHVLKQHTEYWFCPVCGRIYWKGGHWKRIHKTLDRWMDRIGE